VTPGVAFAALAATWPAAATRDLGPVRLRDGAGGGSRVSAATFEAPWCPGDITAAETAMRAEGRAPLFMLRRGEEALDAEMAARGYEVMDPTLILAAPLATLDTCPPATSWPPDPAQRALWASGGIGPERLAAMERAPSPKTVLHLADGCAFVAVHAGTAMLHALEVAPQARRRGTGRVLMAMAADWAREAGASMLALAVTRANAPARALYEQLGFAEIASYHYRRAKG